MRVAALESKKSKFVMLSSQGHGQQEQNISSGNNEGNEKLMQMAERPKCKFGVVGRKLHEKMLRK